MRMRGFTLMELMVALTIGALLVAVGTPMAVKMYDTMRYRDAVRNISAAAGGARMRAVNGGRAIDLMVEPDAYRYSVQPAETPFDRDAASTVADDLSMGVQSARQLVTEQGVAVIRFFPDGSSSGGSITLRRESGQGVRLRIDWLLGHITQQPL